MKTKKAEKPTTIRIDGDEFEIVCIGDDPSRIVTPEGTFVMEPYCDGSGQILDDRFTPHEPLPRGVPVEIRKRKFAEGFPASPTLKQMAKLPSPALNMGANQSGADIGKIEWEVLVAGGKANSAPAVAYYLADLKLETHALREADIVARWKADKQPSAPLPPTLSAEQIAAKFEPMIQKATADAISKIATPAEQFTAATEPLVQEMREAKTVIQKHTEAMDRLHNAADGTRKMTMFTFKRETEKKALASWTHPVHGTRQATIHGAMPTVFVETLWQKDDHTAKTKELDKIIRAKRKEERGKFNTYSDMFARRDDHKLFWSDCILHESGTQDYELKIVS